MNPEDSNTTVFAKNLLAGRSLLVVGSAAQRVSIIEKTATALGAQLVEGPDLDSLVVDTGGFEGGADELTGTLETLWEKVRQVANDHFIPAGSGQVIVVAPTADSGEYAPALRAALENLARTLSIEWSRYGIRSIAILPGDETAPERVASVVAYLSSRAGEYFSGCKLELDCLQSAST